MERKLVAVGGSLAVTLPAELVKELGLKKGQAVELTVHPTTGVVTIRPGVRYLDAGRPTRRFRARVEELLESRKELYRKLAE